MRTKLPTKTRTVEEINHIEAGRRIRNLRYKAGMSLRRLAKEMGLSAPFISDLELGRRNWTRKHFAAALEILGGAK